MNTQKPINLSVLLLIGASGIAWGQSSEIVKGASASTKGLNLNKYNQIVEDVRENPSHGRVEFYAVGESEEMVYHSSARIGPFKAGGEVYGKSRDYVLHLGLPVELQGDVDAPVDRIEPIELALAGLADCVIGSLRVHALINNIDVDHVTATIRAPLDLQVLLAIEDVEKRTEMYDNLSIDVEISGPNLTEEQRIFLSEQLKRSPVYNLIGLAHEMDTTVQVRR